MDSFPPLERWFKVRQDVSRQRYRYVRYDLSLHSGLNDREIDALAEELALLVARLRLRPKEYSQWLKYCQSADPIPEPWNKRFQDRFWKSFVSQSETDKAEGRVQFDEIALQGYLGELMLYIVQHQYYDQRIVR